jgi:dTDP-4-dehydrorhamnose 3,5-epimerase
MKFTQLPLQGAYLIEAEPIVDERGFFTRLICRNEFARHQLVTDLSQASMSHNRERGTLRGMHWQNPPHAETKLVRVIAGSILDTIVDLRPDSPSYKQHCQVQLSAQKPATLYIPEGFAHGFQTLEDHTEVYYHMNREFHAASARGFLWNDPQFGIVWPIENPILSPKDRLAPLFEQSLV